MTTYRLHHTPKTADQDTWCVSFSLPYIATRYAFAGIGVWYIESWLTADQIKRRLSVLFDSPDEMRVEAVGREHATSNTRLEWLPGRLEDDDTRIDFSAPRIMWDALQAAFGGLLSGQRVGTSGAGYSAMAASSGNSRAA